MNALQSELEKEGGLVEDRGSEVSTTAVDLILTQTKVLLQMLVDELEPATCARLLVQISKSAMNAKQLIATFDPNSGIELEGLSRKQQAMFSKSKFTKDRETVGVEAVKQLMGFAAGHLRSQKAGEINSLLAAAARAKDVGDIELAESLKAEARKLSQALFDNDIQPSEGVVDLVTTAVGNLADATENMVGGYSLAPSQGLIAYSSENFVQSDDFEDA